MSRVLPKCVRRSARRVWYFLFLHGMAPPLPWDGHTIALHDLRAIYYKVPKVANTSLSTVCVDLIGFDLPPGSEKRKHHVFRSDLYDDTIDTRKRDLARISRPEADRLKGYWRFGFARNPYDRLVSCFAEKIRKADEKGPRPDLVDGVARGFLRYGLFYYGMPFAEFVDVVASIPDAEADPHFRSQTTFLCNADGSLAVDFLGHFETLAGDVAKVGEHLGHSLALPHILKSDHAPWESYYDDAIRKRVRERYADDFRLLGYDD